MAQVSTEAIQKGIFLLRSGEVAETQIIEGNVANNKELIVRTNGENGPKIYLGYAASGTITSLYGATMDSDLAYALNHRKMIYTGISTLSSNVPQTTPLTYNGLPNEDLIAIGANAPTLINLKLNIVAKEQGDGGGIEASSISVQLYKLVDEWEANTSTIIEYSGTAEDSIGNIEVTIDTNNKLKISAKSHSHEEATDNKAVKWIVEVISMAQI